MVSEIEKDAVITSEEMPEFAPPGADAVADTENSDAAKVSNVDDVHLDIPETKPDGLPAQAAAEEAEGVILPSEEDDSEGGIRIADDGEGNGGIPITESPVIIPDNNLDAESEVIPVQPIVDIAELDNNENEGISLDIGVQTENQNGDSRHTDYIPGVDEIQKNGGVTADLNLHSTTDTNNLQDIAFDPEHFTDQLREMLQEAETIRDNIRQSVDQMQGLIQDAESKVAEAENSLQRIKDAESSRANYA